MLHEFLSANRDDLIRSCAERAAKRFVPAATPADFEHGVPLFLEQLIDTLQSERNTLARDDNDPGPPPAFSKIGRGAALHGAEMLRAGYTVVQVVHEYGDVCQASTDLAVERKELITSDEFRTLNRCVDNAIADAVSAYGADHRAVRNENANTLHERLTSFSSEQRRLLDISIQAFNAIQTGNIGLNGATGTMLYHSLLELRALSESAMAEIRLISATGTLPTP